ncbi:MAG: hypothetical protein IT276_11140 [Ignavibacteriaceae bacterium]|nr:hypothetical protein [Ignavibacteriaceae bacterium]HMN25868.1 hypothetical protein [Ignavibacteriaceae bacterium]HRN26198.1 hypothetical protein [Ignavibacteriaceae bacterium]HRP92111.1 hypothetical protein [Ignavibacteriaceae bacterium]HRQ53812.1 hypothetical protein [Ignavibacteriaceae bacterium]
MLTFLLVLVLVFIGVDLLVRFVIDPLASGSHKKNKVSKSFTPRFDPTIKLASETMYDGGKPHDDEKIKSSNNNENVVKDDSSSLKQ